MGVDQQYINQCFCLCRKVQDKDGQIEKLKRDVSELRDKYSQLQDQNKSDDCKLNWNCLQLTRLKTHLFTQYFDQ